MTDTDEQFMKLDIMLLKLALALVFIIGPSLYLNGCEEKRQFHSDITDLKYHVESLKQRK
jgi:hypothetical protein